MDPNKHDSLDPHKPAPAAFLTDGHCSRRDLLKGVGLFGVGLIVAQSGLLRPETAQAARLWNRAPATGETERVQDILDILATNEAVGVTLVGTVLASARNGAYSPAIPDKVLKILTWVRAQEQFHLDFLKGAGGKLRTDTFHIPDPMMLANPMVLFKDLVELEDAAIAAVMASMHTFTREQRIDLLKANFQFATEESEHRLLANRALGTRPANDHAFAPRAVRHRGRVLRGPGEERDHRRQRDADYRPRTRRYRRNGRDLSDAGRPRRGVQSQSACSGPAWQHARHADNGCSRLWDTLAPRGARRSSSRSGCNDARPPARAGQQ